jgi:hypothetical protein
MVASSPGKRTSGPLRPRKRPTLEDAVGWADATRTLPGSCGVVEYHGFAPVVLARLRHQGDVLGPLDQTLDAHLSSRAPRQRQPWLNTGWTDRARETLSLPLAHDRPVPALISVAATAARGCPNQGAAATTPGKNGPSPAGRKSQGPAQAQRRARAHQEESPISQYARARIVLSFRRRSQFAL